MFCCSFSAQPVRLCDNEDCYNSLPQMVTFPISSLSENKTKLKKKFIRMLYNLGFRVLLGRLCADKKDFYNLLEQIVTFLLLFAGWKKKLRITIGYKNASESPTDFMRTQLHRSAELSRISSLKAWRPCLKGKELIVSRVTRVKLSNQSWWAYINHNMAMHKDFYK